jgi:competence protein ComEA
VTRIERTFLSTCLATLVSAAAFGADAPSTEGKKVNINQATAEQIANLPRVGTKAAQRVVDFRKANGPFARPEGLMEVKGFGEKRFEQLKPYLTVSGPTTLDQKVSSAGSRGGSKGKTAKASSKKTPKSASASASTASVPVGQGR